MAYHSKADELFFGGAAGGGKALAIDTLIKTVRGWSTMGQLRCGDVVLGLDGNPTEVVATSQTYYSRDCYAVFVSDGKIVVADAGHEWVFGSPLCKWRTHEIFTAWRNSGRDKFKLPLPGEKEHRTVFAAFPVRSVPVMCIQVAAKDGIYLCGDGLIPTHNSDLLLGLATTAHRRSLILRREATQLRDLIPRSHELIGLAGQFKGTINSWRYLPGDRSIEFGGCDHENDKQKYKGRAHDLKAWDELSDFSETQYRFVNGWNRTTHQGQRCRIVSAGNPPMTAEGEWVIRRWAPWLDRQHPRPAKPGELRWYAIIDGDEVEREDGKSFTWKREEIAPKSRTFIPARLGDNPFLANTGYAATLQALPEPMRSQLLHGDFTIARQDDPWQVIPTEWIRLAQSRWIAQGGTRPLTALGVDVARGGGDQTVISRRHGPWFGRLDKYAGKETPDGLSVARLIVASVSGRPDAIVNIDVIGVGSSVYDQCRQLGLEGVRPINFAEGVKMKDRAGVLEFANMRAYAYWSFREALDPDRGDGLALPPDPELLADLSAPRWRLTAAGVRLESKEDLKKRIGRSPDCGDAVVLAHLPGPPPFAIGTPGPGRSGRGVVDHAPGGVFAR